MTNSEFKKLFNTLYNNINNNAAPGLSDAEISIFLNKALDEIVKSHVLGSTTTYLVGINQMSKRDVELDSLVKTCNYVLATTPANSYYDSEGFLFELETVENEKPKVLVELAERMIIRKTLTLDGGGLKEWFTKPLDIVELSYTQLNKFMSGVYRHPKKNQCWKIRHDSLVEIILPTNMMYDYWEVYRYNNPEPPEEPPTHEIVWEFKYSMVYVKTPQQIKIANDTSNVECELPEVLHPEILQRAVELAKAAYAAETLSTQMSMGKRSE